MIPIITMAAAERVLHPRELELLKAQIDRDSSLDLTHQPDVSPVTVRSMMIRLGVQPVWGRGGQEVYRMWVEHRLAVFSLEYDPETGAPPPEALSTEFREFTDPDTMIRDIMEHVRGERELAGRRVTITSEDHPEILALGFRSLEGNIVWLLTTEDVEKAVQGKTIETQDVHQLIQSARGRISMASRLSKMDFVSGMDLTDVWAAMSEQVHPKLTESERKGIFIDMASIQLAQRYKNRYLPKPKPQEGL